MGARLSRSPETACQHAVAHAREVVLTSKRGKTRARALVKMLNLAVRPKHAELLYRAGAVDLFVEILEQEPRGSGMRELSLVAMLCLTLDPFVRKDFAAANEGKALEIVFKALKKERPGSPVKYAAIAVLHSLSRCDDNLALFFKADENVDSIMDCIAYEAEGSPLRKLACEVVLSLAQVDDRRSALNRSFLDIAPRMLIGERNRSSTVLETAFEILAILAKDEQTHSSILGERLVVECALGTIESQSNPQGGNVVPETTKAKMGALRMFYHISLGSEATVMHLARLASNRLVQCCVDLLYENGQASATAASDSTSIIAAKILHRMSSYPASRLEIFSARHVADALYQQSLGNLYARMAFVNITGAFDEEDEVEPERKALLGYEDMDDRLVGLVRRGCYGGGKKNSSINLNHNNDDDDDDDDDQEDLIEERKTGDSYDEDWELCTSAMLSLSVLLRRKHHLERLGPGILPLVLSALDRALERNDSRGVSFAMACIGLLAQENVDVSSMDALFDLLGRVQQKVHPSWRPLRVDAERLVSGLSLGRGGTSRLNPVISMLEKVLDDDQKGFTRSLDVPLSSLNHSLTMASKQEREATGRSLMRLIPRALKKALNDNDSVSAQFAFDLYEEIVRGTSSLDGGEWDLERQQASAAVRELRQASKLGA